ncbi:MAG: CDP-alcohol phosphatidyltransferase family protein [Candidatus Omnitrophota bacterium]
MLNLNWPNRLSLYRIITAPVFVICLIYYRPENDYLRVIAIFIFLSAMASDAIDGIIAKATSQKTALGAFLDPLADKLLINSGFICLSLITNLPAQIKFPVWVPIIVIMRDLIIVAGSLVIHILTSALKITPSVLGKLTTFFQMTAIIAVLFQYNRASYLWNMAVIFTVFSGVDYMLKGLRFLNDNAKR